jgi:signal peptidase I
MQAPPANPAKRRMKSDFAVLAFAQSIPILLGLRAPTFSVISSGSMTPHIAGL